MQKKLFVLALVATFALLIPGCKNLFQNEFPKEVKFEVTSSPSGKRFYGYYGNSRTDVGVEGITPKTYTTQLRDAMDIACGGFSKDEPGNWTLTVKMYVDGKLKDHASVSEENASISLCVDGRGEVW